MESLGIWVAPLLLLPGMGLLTISVGARVNHLESVDTPEARRHAVTLRRAQQCLYYGIIIDAVASLIGGLLLSWPQTGRTIVITMSCLGVAMLVAATAFLIAEARQNTRSEP